MAINTETAGVSLRVQKKFEAEGKIFKGKILAVWSESAKTAKILVLENF